MVAVYMVDGHLIPLAPHNFSNMGVFSSLFVSPLPLIPEGLFAIILSCAVMFADLFYGETNVHPRGRREKIK
jgi:hypothetical protein